MSAPDERAAACVEQRALLVLLVAVSLGLAWILLPFYGPILWGTIVALLFAPLYRRLLPRLKRRRNAAALATLGVVLVLVILPLALITAALAREAAGVYQRLQSGEMDPSLYFRGVFEALPGWMAALLDRFGLVDFSTLQERLTTALAQGSQFIATQALGIGQNTFELVVDLFITLYLAFFLIRDGDTLVRDLRHAIPLAPAYRRELFDKFAVVVRATVKGNLLVAALQGALGGLAFWFLGVNGALLWAVVMAFLSLLPAIGAALVWLPVAGYFLLTGALWQGLALTAWGVLVIGLVDNLLRPLLVGKDTRLPDYLVLISTLGGMAVFGINGFVLGPAIAAMFIAVWHIYGKTRSGAIE
ncbi:MAG: AI-2E family transporter [Rubrivivax sp.]|nr:AI-2E family transporter [Rubrivivax sp.]